MNINSYALAVAGTPTKAVRKASDISESPARSMESASADWPALEAPIPSESRTTRTQGYSKKGKASPPDGSQRKLNAFFAFAKSGNVNPSSPPRGHLIAPLMSKTVMETPSSPPSTKRKTTAPPEKANLQGMIKPGPALHIVSSTLTSLGTVRSKTSSSKSALVKKIDPPTETGTTVEKVDEDDSDDIEAEEIMSSIKVYPKSIRKPSTTSSTKRKSSPRVSVLFAPPEPKQVQLVEPEDVPPTPKIDHPYRTVLSTTVRVDKVKDALSNFIGKMVDTIAFLRTHVDPTIAILPKSIEFDNEHIIDKPSFPLVVFLLNQRYFNFESRGAFSDATKTHNGRTVKLSLVLGSTVEINHQLLDEVRHDTMILGVTFWYKPHQEVDTTTRLVFLGAPNNANKEEAKTTIDKLLQSLEQHLVETDPKSYPPEVFGLPWPNFAIVSEQPTGQPYEKPELGKDGKPIQKLYTPPPAERRSLHIMCKKSDYSRLASLVTVAKAKNMWLKEFGMCYPVEAPDSSYSTSQCNDYLKMVDVHESAQLSYGTFRISGLKDPGMASTLRRSIGDPITVTVRQILRMITMPREIVKGKVMPGQSVWLCVLRSDNGTFTGYYAGANQKHQKFASGFSKCPAAQILSFLLRHGILKQDAHKFIRNNFSMAQVRLIGQSKFIRRLGLAVVPIQPGEENILDAARLDNSLVDLSKLTKREFEEEEEITGEYNGPSSADPDCYNFSSAQSVTTIKHNTERIKTKSSGKSAGTLSLGESAFSIRNNGDSDGDDEEEIGHLRTLDPLDSLRNEEVQFDLSFLKSRTSPDVGASSSDSSKDDTDMGDEQESTKEQKTYTHSSTAKVLEERFNNANRDAELAAEAVGLDLSSVATNDPTEDPTGDDECFVTVLAGIGDEARSFAEMFAILDSLIEEAEEADKEVLHTLQEMNIHVPAEIRDLLVEEASESEESVLQHLQKLRDWLCDSEEEEEESAGIDRCREREYDTDGSLLPRPEDYGNEEPQGFHDKLLPLTEGTGAPAPISNASRSRHAHSQRRSAEHRTSGAAFEAFRASAQGRRAISTEDPRAAIEEWSFDRQVQGLDISVIRGSMEHLQRQQRKAIVSRIGNLASVRPEGVWRWMYCQVNSFSVGTTRSEKLQKITELIQKYDVDGVVFCEAGINWSVGPSSRDLKSFFDPYMEREIRAAGSHNIHGPRVSPLQQGGTAILLTHNLLQYAKRHTTDMRKLGRWSSWTLSHNPMHRTRVIVAYSPGQRRKGLKTVYQQQMTYINAHQLQTTPLQLFISDLIKQLIIWKAAGDRLILFIDANESITRGSTCKALLNIGMSEMTHKYWDKGTEPNTHISGSSSIDGIFTTDDIETTNFLSLSFDESIGDHRTMILEVSTASTIGHFQGNIVRPSSRRLTTKQPRVVAAYNARLERQYQTHRIPDRLNGLLAMACSTEEGALGEEISRDIQAIYTEMDQLKINAEAKCRKITKPMLPYSPSTSFWYDQIHAYRVLIRIKAGKAGRNTDVSRAIRTALRKRIPTPRELTIQQCWDGIKVARAYQQQILSHTAMGERKNYLQKQAELAHNNGDEATQKAIHQRMRQEHDKSIWKRIKRVTNTSTSRACMEVQVSNGQSTTTYTKKADIEQAIQQEIKTRFALGNSAPISRTLLGIDLQYLRNTELAFSIINGSYSIPDELDEATKLILHEIGIMGSRVLKGQFSPALTITTADYITYHKRLRESTSSSPSGLHLGHGKAAAFSEELASTHATQMNLIIRSGIHPTRWGTALQVLLEKVAGVCLVEKLRSIQLYEADLNWFMKFIFNDGALNALKAAELLPEEHYSQKGSTAEDACLDKTLTFDISRQTRTPMAIMSVDAAQCYDRVHHGLMSLTWLALIQNRPVVQILLGCLGDMKIYTRTGYGDSDTFFGGRSDTPACGLGQGSKAAPASWIQISSIFVKILREKGFGAILLDPITKAVIHSIGCLFVDDTDLYVLDKKLKSALDVLASAQSAITLWSALLSATGGAIKTEKSFWSMLDYTCKNGEWQYAPFRPYPLTILVDGEDKSMQQHAVTDADKTLGVYHCPAGGHAVHLIKLRERTMEWLTQMKNGHLPPSLVWKSYRIQLWARIKFALGTLTNSLEDAETCLSELDYNLLPLLNVNRHIRTGWRKIHQSFGGIGLLHLPTEQLISRLNILQQHYGTRSTVGHKLSCSLHWLQLQLGHNDNPLLLDYSLWNQLTCRSWWVELWHALQTSPVSLSLKYQQQRPPRQFDKTIMQFLMENNLSSATLITMNRCRNYLNALFLSDIVTADGKHIGQRFLNLRNQQPLDSILVFPREQPTRSDWTRWVNTWRSLTSSTYKLRTPLGPWIHKPTTTWRWFHDKPSNSIIYDAGDLKHIYSCRFTSQTRTGNRYAYSHSLHSSELGIPITISATQTESEEPIISITSQSLNAFPSAGTTSDIFWDTLISGGGIWMWDKFHFHKKDNTSVEWIVQGIMRGSLLWVTDGSHFPQRGPYISGAAWVVADTQSDITMACSFAEHSPSASSYRAETLGLYSIHAFIHAIVEHFHLSVGTIDISCDNDAALKEASSRKKRVGTSASCADVFRGIRSITRQLTAVRWSYTWVKAHMDDVLDWHDLSRTQQLNVMCDTLAKAAVEDAITRRGASSHSQASQLLPHENIAVLVNSVKQTSDPATQIRYACGKHAAKRFLTSEMGWTSQQFEDVDWENLDRCLQSKPDGFRTWLSKQHSNFCATRVQTKRWFGTEDSTCPSCHQVEERAEHLCKCSDPGRRRLLEDDTNDLIRWMSIGENTHPDIIEWVESYILGQDKSQPRLEHCPHSIHSLVECQTRIGWRNFMEGRISIHFHRLQYCHLILAQTNMTAASWTRTFISKLLHITHSQWIFRNFILHDKTHGLLRFKEQGAILLHLEALSLSDKNDLPEESRFLLEFDIGRLQQADFETQCYWVAAVNAARSAIFGDDTGGATTSKDNHILSASQQRQPSRQSMLPWVRPPTEERPYTHRPSPSSIFTRQDSNRNIKPD